MGGGVCGLVGDMHGRGMCMAGGHVWQGACGCAWQEACGCAWQEACVAGGMHGRGVCVWQVGGMHGRGACVAHTLPPGRYYEIRSMSGRYASSWNAFLFELQTTNHR